MSDSGNNYALSTRDRIVGHALESENASINYQKGNKFRAALYDFTGNLFMGAVPQTLMGLGIIIPYFTAARQGWIGGIVSVDSRHISRLHNVRSSVYYFLVLLLQFIPYSLAIGAGIKGGVDLYRQNVSEGTGWQIRKLKFPGTILSDLLYVYIIVVPLFFLASCFEFLSSWNV